jgi:hypothetical protein
VIGTPVKEGFSVLFIVKDSQRFIVFYFILIYFNFISAQQEKIDEHQILVDQLEMEVRNPRTPTSQTCSDLIESVRKEEINDPLMNPRLLINNPFVDKKWCPCILN